MTKITKATDSRKVDTRRRWLVFGGIFLVGVLVYDLSGFGGNIRFYAKWAECGQKPVGTKGSGYSNVGAIHYVYPPIFEFGRPYGEYFCTPLEAEQAGYSANPDRYEFPNLENS